MRIQIRMGNPEFASWIDLEWGFPKKVHQCIVHTESTCIIYPDYIICAPKTMPKSRVSEANCEQFIMYLLYCEPTNGVFFCFTFLELYQSIGNSNDHCLSCSSCNSASNFDWFALLTQISPARNSENSWLFVFMEAHKSHNALRVRIRITHTHQALMAKLVYEKCRGTHNLWLRAPKIPRVVYRTEKLNVSWLRVSVCRRYVHNSDQRRR